MEEVKHRGQGADPERATPAAAVPGPGRGGTPPPPLPVRSAMGTPPGSQPAAAAPAPPPQAYLEVEGVRWVVRELGRAGSPQAPLLLLGFFHPDDPEEPRREALVTARALDGISEHQLEAAWGGATTHVPAGTRRPFFPEITARGPRDE